MPIAPFTKGYDLDDVPASGYKYVRRHHRGRLWQARVTLGPHSGSPRLNLGLYPHPRDAWRAVVAWLRTHELPDGILPTYLRRTPDRRFVGRCTRAGRRVEVGPCDTPQEAARLLAAALAGLPPRPRRPKPDPTAAEVALLAAARAVAAERGKPVAVGVPPAGGGCRRWHRVDPPASP